MLIDQQEGKIECSAIRRSEKFKQAHFDNLITSTVAGIWVGFYWLTPLKERQRTKEGTIVTEFVSCSFCSWETGRDCSFYLSVEM